MRITYIIFCLFFTNSLLLKYGPFYPEESQYVQSQKDLIFESNVGEVENLISISYDLIEKAFNMENFGSGEIVQIIIMKSIDFFTQNAYCVCQLLQNNQSQIIICKDGITISENKKKLNVLQFAKKYTIQVDGSLGKCEELQSDQKNQLLCFCYSQNSLGILTINLRKQIHYIQKLKFQLDILDCQRKVFDRNLDIIVAFYNCTNWMIIEKSDSELKIIFDRDEFKKLNYSDEIYNLVDVVICQSNIYLIEPYFYLIINLDNNNISILHKITRISSTKIFKLILDQKCQDIFLIIQNESTNEIKFDRHNKEISINISSYDQLINTDQYMMLRKEGVLKVILSSFFNQTYQVESNNLMFQHQSPTRSLINKEIQNLMYQINFLGKDIQFYWFYNYLSIIKPTQRYFYTFVFFDYFFDIEQSLIFQSENYLFQSQQNKKEVNLSVVIDCQNIQQIVIDKKEFVLPNKIQYDLISQNDQLSIIYDESYEKKCALEIIKFPTQLIWQIYNQYNQITIFIFLLDENLIYYNCDNNSIFHSYHIGKRELLSFKWQVFLAQSGDKKFTVIDTSLETFSESIIDLESKIKSFKQFQEQIFIELENHNFYSFDLISQELIQLEDDFAKYDDPLFIFVIPQIRIVQVKNFLIIQQKDQPAQYFFEDFGQIIRVDFSNFIIRIRSVYMYEKKIQTFIYSKQMIQKDQMYLINKQIDLISPLVMSDSLNYLAIAAKMNNSSRILLIQINNVITMRQITISPKLVFKQIVGQLIYLSQNNNFKVFHLETLTLQFNTPQPFVKQYFATKNYSFSIITYLGENLQTTKGNFNVLFENACYSIFSLKESMIANDINKQSLKISDIFYGSIDYISSSNQDKLQIIGPILQTAALKECKQKDEIICLKYFTTKTQSQYQVQCSYKAQLKKILFCLNTNSKLFFSYLEIEKENFIVEIINDDLTYYLLLFFVDLSQNILIERQKIQLQNLDMQPNEFYLIQFQLLNNLFHFTHAGSSNYHFYLLQPDYYKYYSLEQRIFSIIQIEQQDNQYLIGCQIVKDSIEIEFKIITFSNDQIIVDLIQTKLSIENFLKADNFILEIYKIKENLFWKKILNCQRYENYLNISLIGMSDSLTFQVLFQTDLEGTSQNLRLIQLLRNPTSFKIGYNYQVDHFDANFAILSDYENKFYYFNLKEKLPMIHHMKEYKNQDYEFQQFNNTHYLYYLKESTEIFLGEIGYQIQVVQGVENQNYSLIASNEVSSANVRIQYFEQKRDLLDYNFSQILIVVLLIAFILIIITFCIRRQNHLYYKKQEMIKQYDI